MSIVNTIVTQTQAPTPSVLMRTGTMISQGATTTANGTRTLITQPSDLTNILAGVKANTSITWSGGVVTVTSVSALGLTTNDTFAVTVAGVAPAGFNGSYTATVTGANTFTYPLATSPGTATTVGTWTPEDVGELLAMVTTFFSMGSSLAVYVLELGLGSANDGVASLTTYLNANAKAAYRYLVPRTWDANASFLALCQVYQSTTAKTYFHVTTTNATFSSYTVLQKAVVALIEAPGVPSTEFSAAAAFWAFLFPNPSSTNKVAPFSYTFLYGVTPYPTAGNSALFTAWKAAGVNWVGTGAEGGISTAILLRGTGMDTRPVNYWYTTDWVQINIDLNISNAVINGSNNPINPLYLDQPGINRLQKVGASTLTSGVTFGMILGTVVQTELNSQDFDAALDAGTYAGNAVINAVPFTDYFTASPSDYKTGTYNGYSVTMTPLRGFDSVTFNINVTDFVAP